MTHLVAYSIVVVKLATKRPRLCQKDIIKTNVKGFGCDGMYRNQVCQDRNQRQAVVYMAVRMLFLHNARISFLYLGDYYLLKKVLFQVSYQQY
jgi:hypothetical protein